MSYAELWQIKYRMTSYCIHSVMRFKEHSIPRGYMQFSYTPLPGELQNVAKYRPVCSDVAGTDTYQRK